MHVLPAGVDLPVVVFNPPDYFVSLVPDRNQRGSDRLQIGLINPGPSQVVYAGNKKALLCSAVVPSLVHQVHALVTVSGYGIFDRHWHLLPDDRAPESTDHLISLKATSSHTAHLNSDFSLTTHQIPLNHGVASRLTLRMHLSSLRFRVDRTARVRQGSVFEITTTFVIFVQVVTPMNGNVLSRKENVVAKFLLRMHDYKKKRRIPPTLTSSDGIQLPATLQRFRAGGKLEIESIPALSTASYRLIADEERTVLLRNPSEFYGRIRDRFAAALQKTDGEEEIEEKGERSTIDETSDRFLQQSGRKLLSCGSYYHAESGSLWPMPISSPILNVRLDGSKLVLSSQNLLTAQGRPTSRLHLENASVRPPRHSVDGIVQGLPWNCVRRIREFLPKFRDLRIIAPPQCRPHGRNSFRRKTVVEHRIVECLYDGPNGMIHVSTRFPDAFILKSAPRGSGAEGEKEMLKEALIWERVCRPNARVYFGCFKNDGKFALGFYRYSSDCSALFRSEKMCTDEKLYLLLLFADDLKRIHDHRIAHCDLKPENLLREIDAGAFPPVILTICDFGLAVDWKACQNGITPRGTPGYMPSRFDCDPRKIDIYSFGISAWELWTQSRAFAAEREDARFLCEGLVESGASREEAGIFAIQGFMESIRGRHPSFEVSECHDMPHWLKLFLHRCWSDDPDSRPSASDAVELLNKFRVTESNRWSPIDLCVWKAPTDFGRGHLAEQGSRSPTEILKLVRMAKFGEFDDLTSSEN